MPSIAVRLDDDIQARLKSIAHIDDRTPHYVMKKAIESYVAQREGEIESERLSIERWDDYKRTQVAVPGDKLRDWVRSLPRD